MLRLLSIAVVLLFLGLLELVNGECSTSNCLGCKKGCKSQDFSGFQYSGGSKILSQHNKLRRRFGVPNLKWSNTLEYQAWYTMQQDPTCSHAATNRFKNAIINEVGQHLQCESYWCGHYENLAIGDVPTGVQRWINEGPGGGHHDNMVSSDVAWVGCWHKGDCLKCLYWGK